MPSQCQQYLAYTVLACCLVMALLLAVEALRANPAPVYRPDPNKCPLEGKTWLMTFDGSTSHAVFDKGGQFLDKSQYSDHVWYKGHWTFYPASGRLNVSQGNLYQGDADGWTILLEKTPTCYRGEGLWGQDGREVVVEFKEVSK